MKELFNLKSYFTFLSRNKAYAAIIVKKILRKTNRCIYVRGYGRY